THQPDRWGFFLGARFAAAFGLGIPARARDSAAMKEFRLAGVIGWPVSHSLSPRLHRAWLEELGIAGAYVPLPVEPHALPAAFARLKALGFAGANVTVPHKEAVLKLVDTLDPTARAIGAVNTLVIEHGRIEGRNTDAFGFIEHLKASQPEWRTRLASRPVL